MKYRSIAVPVEAVQFDETVAHMVDEHGVMYIQDSYGNILPLVIGDWIVYFPNNEIHVVADKCFKQRFEQTDKFTKQELTYARRMAEACDCE